MVLWGPSFPAWLWLVALLAAHLCSAQVISYAAEDMSCSADSPAQQATMAALMGIYSKLNGRQWKFYQLAEVIGRAGPGTLRWGSCSTCNVPLTNVGPGRYPTISMQQFTMPSYCCWRGVTCCLEPHTSLGSSSSFVSINQDTDDEPEACQLHSVTGLQLWGLGLSGPFDGIMPELQVLHSLGLKHLDLSKNFLTGTLPENLGDLDGLTHLLLGSNIISGTVPTSVRNMSQLMQLDLEINKLTGSLDQGQLCRPDNNTLSMLLIRGNNFSGTLDLRECRRLQLADLQGNRFSGSFPVDGSNRGLSVLRADHNSFNGTIPVSVWDLPSLMALELTNNSLTGTLPKAIAAANFLVQLRLGCNNFSGTVPMAINTLSHLAELDLSDNPRLAGTLPSMKWMHGLQSLSLRRTRIGGKIPQDLALLPYLESVDVRDTRMTCCSSLQEAKERHRNGTLLPSYLTLDVVPHNGSSVEEEYITAAGNMKCGMVKRSPRAAMVAQGFSSNPVNVSRQTWMVGPEYTWYMRCSCVKGFEPGPFTVISTPASCSLTAADNSSNGTLGDSAPLASLADPNCHSAVTAVMTCQAVSNKVNSSLVAGIVSAGTVLLLLMLLVYLSFKRLGRIKRQLEWWKKHLAGMPTCGEMSLVVTDIEGYSGMFKRAPEQMYRALTLHNNVIRHAKYVNCGSILQQEGDSFTLAFHTAFDAVAFCLQVQLGLMEVPWPKGLAEVGSSDGSSGSNGSSSDGCADKGHALQHQGSQCPLVGSGGSTSSTTPPRRKLSQRLEAVPSMLISPTTANKLRKSRLATGSPPPPPPQLLESLAFPATTAAAAAAVGSNSPKQAAAPGGCGGSSGSSSFSGQPGTAAVTAAPCDSNGSEGNTGVSPTKQQQQQMAAERSQREQPAPVFTCGAPSRPFAAAGGGVAAVVGDGGGSPTSGAAMAAIVARLASGCSNASKASSSFFTGSSAPFSGGGLRFLSGFGGASNAAGGLFKMGSSMGRGKQHGSDGCGSNGPPGNGDSSDGCSSGDGLFCGLRVRMGVVTGAVHWEAGGAAQSGSSSSNSIAAIINSSLYKLALDVSDAGNGGQVLLDASTFLKIKEELAPLGVVDANGVDYAKLEAARPFSLWQALRGRRKRNWWGRTRAQSDEAVVLDMGLWQQQQQCPPTTPTSPAPTSAAAAAAMRSSLPGAMPARAEMTPGQQHYSLPVSPVSSGGGAASSHDGWAAAGGWGGGGWAGNGAAAGGGGWGFWGSGAASAAGGGYGGGGAQSCATAGSGGESGCRLRLYQVLPPRLAGRALVWGDALSLKGSWVCLDAPYFEAPGATFYSVFTHTGSSSVTSGSRSSSMTKAADIKHWQAMMLQQQQLVQLQQQQGLQSYGSCGLAAAGGGAAAAGAGVAVAAADSAGISRQSSCIPALYYTHSGQIQQQQQQHRGVQAAAAVALHNGKAPLQQQQQQLDGHVFSQLTVSAVDVEAPHGLLDQQQQQQQQLGAHQLLPLPALFRPGSSTGPDSILAAAAAAAAAAGVGVYGGAAVPPPQLLLPAVTLLFVSVEGSKVMRKHLVREAHCQLSLLFMESLRHVQGGYMCRMQAGDLKYMVAFASAPAALQWALAVQEAAMYLDYPTSFDRAPQLRAEYDSKGQLVFRGPRLRMGLCEGVPRTVMPDHVGRADYYGSSVNMAARYMDAAAHGGQIACELDLALTVMRQWTGSSGGSRGSNGGSSSGGGRGSSGSSGSSGGGCNGSAQVVPDQQHVALSVSATGPAAVTTSAAAAAATTTAGATAGAPASSRVGGSCGSTPKSFHLLPEAFSSTTSDLSCSDSHHSSSAAGGDLQQQQLQQQRNAGSKPMQDGQCCPASQRCASAPLCTSDPLAQQKPPLCWQQMQQQVVQQQQQKQQQRCEFLPPPQQQQQQPESLFSLQDAPMLSAAVEVQRLGAFRFKGSSLQHFEMANATLSSLAGRAAFTPAEPPKGKGERLAAGNGVVATQGVVPLPALIRQYRSRVPAHILEQPVELTAGDSVSVDCEAVRAGSLRVISAPQHLMGSGSALASCRGGHGEGCRDDEGFEVVEVLGLRQKSHSFTCPASPGL